MQHAGSSVVIPLLRPRGLPRAGHVQLEGTVGHTSLQPASVSHGQGPGGRGGAVSHTARQAQVGSETHCTGESPGGL